MPAGVNCRRTQEDDFEALRVFVPNKDTQTRIVEAIVAVQNGVLEKRPELGRKLEALNHITLSAVTEESLTELLAGDES